MKKKIQKSGSRDSHKGDASFNSHSSGFHKKAGQAPNAIKKTSKMKSSVCALGRKSLQHS